MAKKREEQEPGLTEEQLLADQFFDLYKGLHRAYGKFQKSNLKEENGKAKGRSSTEIGTYNVKLWNAHLNGNIGLGVVPIQDDGTCWWGAIDIDEYPLDLPSIEQKIRQHGLPLIVLRTKSGGAHLTMFLSEPVSCKTVRARLYEFALVLGYGGVEIFPKQVMLANEKDVGNWLNMPYYEHKATERYAIFNGEPITALQFVELARQVRISEQQLWEIQVNMAGDFEDGPPCLQMICSNKVQPGTRNNTLFALGVYARKKYEDDWEKQVEEMNIKYITPQLSVREVTTIVKSLGRKDYFYPCNKAPLINACNKDLCRKRPFGIGQGEMEFNLNLGSLIKITSDPPVWIMDVEGVRVQLDTEDLMTQERFRRVCVMAINRLPPRIKAGEWDKIVREKLESVEMVEAPVESKHNSRINQYAFMYLSITPPARSKDEIMLGRPWLDKEEGTVNFSGNALMKFLDNNGIRTEPRKIWTSLREAGADHAQMKIKNVSMQVWRMKAELIPEIDLDTPDLDEDQF